MRRPTGGGRGWSGFHAAPGKVWRGWSGFHTTPEKVRPRGPGVPSVCGVVPVWCLVALFFF